MDTDSMGFGFSECFSVFDSPDFLDNEESQSTYDDVQDAWDWDTERELNGDYAVIQIPGKMNSFDVSTHEEFKNTMNDWHSFVDVTGLGELSMDFPPPIDTFRENISYLTNEHIPLNTHLPDSAFPIESKPTAIWSPPKPPTYPRGGKKIDMEAQCYVISNDESAEDSDSEPSDHSDLEDGTHKDAGSITIKEEIDVEDVPVKSEPEDEHVDVETVSDNEAPLPVLEARDLNSLLEQFEASERSNATNKQKDAKEIESKPDPPKPERVEVQKNKQIRDALPAELINRIKASSKRKVVSVIEPVLPRRGTKRSHTQMVQNTFENSHKPVKAELPFVHTDHNYCSLSSPYPKCPKKDSGFASGDDDDQCSVLKSQPIVKGANGKLMVSLLKENTVHNMLTVSVEQSKKRKLNLEEYKKRREGLIKSTDTSQNNSPASSGRNSPIIEDEKTRIIKHQQKLLQMASEVLKTPPPKLAQKTDPKPLPTAVPPPNIEKKPFSPPAPVPPADIEVKTIVSRGVNTDESGNTCVRVLEEIKPILETASSKIGTNSLLVSVIENIQNKSGESSKDAKQAPATIEHGEDKTVIYLNKNRPPVLTRTVSVQTDVTKDTQILPQLAPAPGAAQHHGRRCRRRSSSSCSSRSRSSSAYSSSSRERSRSPSPWRRQPRANVATVERERLREVDERRIVYVGGIGESVSKEELRRRFEVFGPITNVSVHFRDYGLNYGFVTFAYKVDAYDAVENGNNDPDLPKYDLSFGGRRLFCRQRYSDLDNLHDEAGFPVAQQNKDSFDHLLREMQAKIRNRKSKT